MLLSAFIKKPDNVAFALSPLVLEWHATLLRMGQLAFGQLSRCVAPCSATEWLLPACLLRAWRCRLVGCSIGPSGDSTDTSDASRVWLSTLFKRVSLLLLLHRVGIDSFLVLSIGDSH